MDEENKIIIPVEGQHGNTNSDNKVLFTKSSFYLPDGIAKYNISKFCILAIASLLIALGTHLATNESNKMIIAACLSALGNFTWGYCTTGQYAAKDKRADDLPLNDSTEKT